jgi:hypothetical protein
VAEQCIAIILLSSSSQLSPILLHSAQFSPVDDDHPSVAAVRSQFSSHAADVIKRRLKDSFYYKCVYTGALSVRMGDAAYVWAFGILGEVDLAYKRSNTGAHTHARTLSRTLILAHAYTQIQSTCTCTPRVSLAEEGTNVYHATRGSVTHILTYVVSAVI